MNRNTQNLNKIIEMINNDFKNSYRTIFEELKQMFEEDLSLCKLQLNDNNILSVFSQIIPKLSCISDFSTHLSFLPCYFKFIETNDINEEICLGVTNYIRNVIMKWNELSNGVDSTQLKQYFQTLSSIIECVFTKIDNDDIILELYYDNLLCLNDILSDNIYLISSTWKPMIKHSITKHFDNIPVNEIFDVLFNQINKRIIKIEKMKEDEISTDIKILKLFLIFIIGFSKTYITDILNNENEKLNEVITSLCKWRLFLNDKYASESIYKLLYDNIYSLIDIIIKNDRIIDYLLSNNNDNSKIDGLYLILIDLLKYNQNSSLYSLLFQNIYNDNPILLYKYENIYCSEYIVGLIERDLNIIISNYSIQNMMMKLFEKSELFPFLLCIYVKIFNNLKIEDQKIYHNTIFSYILYDDCENNNMTIQLIYLLNNLYEVFQFDVIEYYLNELSICEIYRYNNYVLFIKYYNWKDKNINTNSSLNYILNSLFYQLNSFVNEIKSYSKYNEKELISIIECLISLFRIKNNSSIKNMIKEFENVLNLIIPLLPVSTILFLLDNFNVLYSKDLLSNVFQKIDINKLKSNEMKELLILLPKISVYSDNIGNMIIPIYHKGLSSIDMDEYLVSLLSYRDFALHCNPSLIKLLIPPNELKKVVNDLSMIK